MQFLEGPEGTHHIFFFREGFGACAEFLFRLEVLLEVEVAELLVDLHVVVEFLDVVLVGVVEVLHLVLRHGARGTPTALDVAEFGEGLLEVFAGFDQGLELVDEAELGL